MNFATIPNPIAIGYRVSGRRHKGTQVVYLGET